MYGTGAADEEKGSPVSNRPATFKWCVRVAAGSWAPSGDSSVARCAHFPRLAGTSPDPQGAWSPGSTLVELDGTRVQLQTMCHVSEVYESFAWQETRPPAVPIIIAVMATGLISVGIFDGGIFRLEFMLAMLPTVCG